MSTSTLHGTRAIQHVARRADPIWNDAEEIDPPRLAPEGVKLARFLGWDESGQPLIQFANAPAEVIPALTTVRLRCQNAGCQVVVIPETGTTDRFVILGLIQPPGPVDDSVSVESDGQRVELKADREIVLRCGEASITLTSAGKVLIKGAYVCTRSSGQNSIKGATVHIN